MKIRIDINLEDHNIAMAIACMEISGYKKINSRSVREYLKSYIRSCAEDNLHLIDREFRNPEHHFYEIYCDAREKLKGIK